MTARFLQQARRALLLSPSLPSPPRLHTLLRPPFPCSSPSSSPHPYPAARTYIAGMRRSAFQENVLRILRTEIDYEIDVRPPQESVKQFKSFAVEDRPGEQWITLRRRDTWDNTKVDVTMFDYAIPVDPKTEDSEGEKTKLHISVVVDVVRHEGCNDESVLQFICSAWPDALEIEHLRVVHSDRVVLCPFMGPRFKDMDKELQDAMQEFLETREVDDELAAFLHEYMMNKDRREYVRWLGNVKSYVEK